MAPDLLALLFHAPPEGVQTGLAAVAVLAFGMGVATIGTLYRLIILRAVSAEVRELVARAAERVGEHARDLAVADASAPRLIALLVRYALSRGPHV